MSASLVTRRTLAGLLAAGALIGVAAVPAAADDHRRDRGQHTSLVIGDVENAGRGRDNRALNSEWVEVKNTGRHGVQLRGFTLTD
ncbi:lamin tail domain-containing protein, partial [Streptomyces sp. NPDC090054]